MIFLNDFLSLAFNSKNEDHNYFNKYFLHIQLNFIQIYFRRKMKIDNYQNKRKTFYNLIK